MVIASLAPHLGPVSGSLSFASTVTTTGAWLFFKKGSRSFRLRPPLSVRVSPSRRESTRRSSRAPERSTRCTSRRPWSSMASYLMGTSSV